MNTQQNSTDLGRRKIEVIVGRDQIVNHIYQTYDYDKFHISPYNRKVAEDRKERVKQSILARNLQVDNPIVVTEEGTILAGQARYLSIVELNLPLNYMFAKDMTLEDIRMLGDFPQDWTMSENFDYWVNVKRQAYLILEEFIKEFPWLSISNAARLIGKGKMGGRAYTESFNRGDFNPGNLHIGTAIAEMVQDFSAFVPDIYRSHAFVSVMKNIIKDPRYDHKRMMHKMKGHGSLLKKQALADEYYSIISEIYNKHAREKDRHDFRKPRDRGR